MACCNRWVGVGGGVRRMSLLYFLQLLYTYWPHGLTGINTEINSILTGVPLHKSKHIHMPFTTWLINPFFFSGNYFWVCKKKGRNFRKSHPFSRAFERRKGKVRQTPEQKETSPKQVCLCGWSVRAHVSMHMRPPRPSCMRLLVIESGSISVFAGNFDSLASLF